MCVRGSDRPSSRFINLNYFVHKHTVYLRQYNLAGLIQSEPSQHFHTALYFSIYIILYFTLSFVKSFHVAFESISDDDAAQKAVYFFIFLFFFVFY